MSGEAATLAPLDPPLVWNECSSKEFPSGAEPAFDGPERPLMEALFHHMSRWVDQGIAPPRAPLIEADDAKTLLDAFGNARGGRQRLSPKAFISRKVYSTPSSNSRTPMRSSLPCARRSSGSAP